MNKRVIVILSTLILVFSFISISVSATESTSVEKEDEISFREDFGLDTHQSHLNKVSKDYDKDFYKTYGLKLLPIEVKEFKLREEIASDAPKIEKTIKNSSLNDIYAGMFMEQQTGKLNLAFKKAPLDITEIEHILEEFPFGDDVNIIKVNHTKDELDKVSEEIFNSSDDYTDQYGFRIIGVLSVFSEGKINIQISNNSDPRKVKEAIQKDYDVPVEVEKVKNNELNDESATVRPGEGLTGCTAGFPATKGSNYYMITAGHCSATTFNLSSNGEFVGNRSNVYDKNSGSVDAVAIDVNRSQLSSSLVYSSASLNEYENGELLGQTVWIQGSRSGVMSPGTLKSTSYHFDYEGESYHNMRASDYSSQTGDSGGTIHNSSKLMGVHKGTFGGYKAYTHVTEIISEFGITPYFP